MIAGKARCRAMPPSMRRTTIEGIFDGPGERSTCFRPTRKFCLWSGVCFAPPPVMPEPFARNAKRTGGFLCRAVRLRLAGEPAMMTINAAETDGDLERAEQWPRSESHVQFEASGMASALGCAAKPGPDKL